MIVEKNLEWEGLYEVNLFFITLDQPNICCYLRVCSLNSTHYGHSKLRARAPGPIIADRTPRGFLQHYRETLQYIFKNEQRFRLRANRI